MMRSIRMVLPKQVATTISCYFSKAVKASIMVLFASTNKNVMTTTTTSNVNSHHDACATATTATVDESALSFLENLPALESKQSQRIYLLRHGETDWNKQGLMQGGGYDIPLNENGVEQAKSVSNVLKTIPFGLIVSSHLERAKQTADVVYNDQQEQRIQSKSSNNNDNNNNNDDNIINRIISNAFGEMRFGELEGLAIHGPLATDETRNKFKDLTEKMAKNKHMRWPGTLGESTADVELRARTALEDILQQYPNIKHIAIVAHGRTNKILLASLLWNDASKFQQIKQGNTCINVLDYNNRSHNVQQQQEEKKLKDDIMIDNNKDQQHETIKDNNQQDSHENPWSSVILNHVGHVTDVPERHQN